MLYILSFMPKEHAKVWMCEIDCCAVSSDGQKLTEKSLIKGLPNTLDCATFAYYQLLLKDSVYQ